MARNMSFMLTEQQIRARAKTVTRRLGWHFLQAGQEVKAVRKGMGLKKGEKVEVLARLRVVSVRRELLSSITQADVDKEGFPHLNTLQFIAMFMKHMGQRRGDPLVTRIEFEYLD